jgi:bla regulator protein BlaR1
MMALALKGLESVFGWLLEASWQASVLAALVLSVQWLLGSRLNPRWRYALWLLVLLRLVLPILPESALSLFQYAPTPSAAFTAPVTEPLFLSAPEPLPQVHVLPMEQSEPLSLYSLLALAWLAGALGLLILTWQVNRRFAIQIRKSPEITDPGLLEIFATAQAELGLYRSIRLIENAQVQSPAIMGLFQPTLLLPADVRAKFDPTELRLIFLHELAHLKRGDVIVQWLIAVLQILHWFNPMLWFAFRRMRADREPATDALVLSRTGEDEKERYGLMLIKLLEHFNQRHSLPTLVGILEDKDQFKRRFSLIARFTRGAYGWSLLGIFIIAILAAACLTKSKAIDSTSRDDGEKTFTVRTFMFPDGFFETKSSDTVDIKRELIGHGIEFSGDATVIYLPAQNKFVARNTPEQLDKIATLIETFLDTKAKTNTDSTSALKTNDATAKSTQIEIEFKLAEITEDAYQAHKTAIDSAVDKGGSALVGFLNLVNNLKGVSLVSAPSVTTQPGLKANIDIVRKFPYPVSFDNALYVSQENGGPKLSIPPTPREFVTKDIGVSAEITPSLAEENSPDHGKIILNGKFSVTDFTGFTKIEGFTQNGTGVGMPSFNTSETLFFEALEDKQLKAIWIPGTQYDEQAVTEILAGKNVSSVNIVKKRRLLMVEASLIK